VTGSCTYPPSKVWADFLFYSNWQKTIAQDAS